MPSSSPPTTDLPPVFARHQALIGAALREQFAGRDLPIYDTLRYYMGWADADGNPTPAAEGKALRPTMCLMACEAVGGDPERAVPAAAAVELVHNFSLIHDDIEDRDQTRRHRPTLWVVWGEPAALVAGNGLLAIADLAIHGLRRNGVRPDIATRAGSLLTERYLSIMEGQYQDIANEGRTDITVDAYLAMIERKTGALIEGSVYLGALIGATGEDGIVTGLRAVGEDMGRIFQIRDDVLGIWGGPALGKPVGTDIVRKKNSLPIVHAFEHADGPGRRMLEAVFQQERIDGPDVERVLELMEGLDTQRWCMDQAASRWRRARERIGSLGLPAGPSAEFIELGEYLLVRDA